MSNGPQFGTPEEFNGLASGNLVSPQIRIAPRPTLVTSLTGGFCAWPEPSLSSRKYSNWDWLADEGQGASAVAVAGDVPVNVVATFPKLRCAPGNWEAEFHTNISPQVWSDIGLDSASQAPMWRHVESRARFYIGGVLLGYGYQYYVDSSGRQRARRCSDQVFSDCPFTCGVAIEPSWDFARVILHIAFVIVDRCVLPAGDYEFELDAQIIPREIAYNCWDNDIPPEHRYLNVNLASLPSLPDMALGGSGTMPADMAFPGVSGVIPDQGRVDDRIEIVGDLLATTTHVWFGDVAQSRILESSSNSAVLTVPPGATTSQLKVSTKRGDVLTPCEFEVTKRPPFRSGDTKIWTV